MDDFLIDLTSEDQLRWPADFTTITDGGALLLFRKEPRNPGGPTKVLVSAYSQNAWVRIVRVPAK